MEVLYSWLQVRSTHDLMLVLPLYLLSCLAALILPVNVTCTRYCFGIMYALLWTHMSEQSIHLVEWWFGFILVTDWPTQLFSSWEML